MSEKKPKDYVPKSSCKEHTFQSGDTILKLSFKAAELGDFVRSHKNEKGYINLIIAKRREPGQYGDTHSVYFDDFVPKPQPQGQPPRQAPQARPAPQPEPSPVEEDDVPF